MAAKLLTLILILGTVTACTGRKSEETASAPAMDDQSLEAKSLDAEVNEIVADDTIIDPDETAAQIESEIADQNSLVENKEAAPTNAIVVDQTMEDRPSGIIEKRIYKVKRSETLMLIAFKLYGDYSKWRELRNLNKDKLIGGNLVKAGSDIEYMSNGSEFNWQPKGNPHLIRSGDTLSLISKEYYGNLKRWKDIWENNRPMIKDPNKIYAGFTLYYVPESKNVALQ